MKTTVTLGSRKIGDVVSLNIKDDDGDFEPIDFIVVNQGNPNPSLYDSSCDGTWLLMKEAYCESEWGDYTYCPDIIKPKLDSLADRFEVKIPTATIPGAWVPLNARLFFLSPREVGVCNNDYHNKYDPLVKSTEQLEFFKSASDDPDKDEEMRVAYLKDCEDYQCDWFLRSPDTYDHEDDSLYEDTSLFIVESYGSIGSCYILSDVGVRPALILSPDTLVDASEKSFFEDGPILIGDFGLNADVNRRDQILFGEDYVSAEYVDGARAFSDLAAETIKEFIDGKFIDQNYRYGKPLHRAPSAQMFLGFMKEHKQFTAFGYAVSPESDDYNVVITGIEAKGRRISKKVQDEFKTEFAKADELIVNSTHCRCFFE